MRVLEGGFLRREPQLFDLAAWQERLGELRAEPSEYRSDMLIADAEAHIRAIGGDPENLPAQAQT